MVSRHKVGLVFGGVAAIGHIVWSALVALGWAEAVRDFAINLHFMDATYYGPIMPFSFWGALELVVIASLFAYVLGFVFAAVWNRMMR